MSDGKLTLQCSDEFSPIIVRIIERLDRIEQLQKEIREDIGRVLAASAELKPGSLILGLGEAQRRHAHFKAMLAELEYLEKVQASSTAGAGLRA
jgi:hypothetical protein